MSPEDLELGALLAEGGEGRVFEVVRARASANLSGGEVLFGGLVYKQLRRPHQPPALAEGHSSSQRAPGAPQAVTAYLQVLAETAPALAARVSNASAWPLGVVVGPGSEVLGFVFRRAPERFWLSHRDGSRRLAVLSYLSSDPDRVAISYGVDVPPPGSAPRVGLVYALARLLDAWQPVVPPGEVQKESPAFVVHGDLSSKNVLWSLDPAPEVFVLDCDGAVVLGQHEDAPGHPRPATPNWDDPARLPGEPPTVATDRYALGLVFLRVLGAAHFPLQGRQRQGVAVGVDLELPRSWRRLTDMPRLWSLCEGALSVEGAAQRPTPAEWAYEMQELLSALGADALAAEVRAAQGDLRPEQPPSPSPGRAVADVTVRPVLGHRAPSTWQLVHAGPVTGPGPSSAATLIVPVGPAGPGGAVVPRAGLFGLPPGAPPRALLRAGWATFKAAHGLVWHLLRSPGRRLHGVRRLVGVALLDLAVSCLGLFLFGMAVSPWIGL